MDRQIRRLVLIFAFLVCIAVAGVAGFSVVEHLSPEKAFYFVFVTIATVGYGDIVPTTPLGRALAILLIAGGVGSFVAFAAEGLEMLLSRREKEEQKRKVAMLLGVFFSECGNTLLRIFRDAGYETNGVFEGLYIDLGWTAKDYSRARNAAAASSWRVAIRDIDLPALLDLLGSRRSFLVQLLQHPAFFEHEEFTDLVTAVFHLLEELEVRDDFSSLPPADLAHLSNDAGRVYGRLVLRWIDHMEHLQEHYPYLFSLAVRTNPFNTAASAVIKTGDPWPDS